MITVINEQRETALPHAKASGESLWLDRAGIEQAVAWDWKPEGLCQGDICVPLPTVGSVKATSNTAIATDSPIVHDGLLDLAAMWRYMGHPVAHDAASQTWVLGASAGHRSQALTSMQAPDFALPDLQGNMHSLSQYRGKKVFLATWASW